MERTAVVSKTSLSRRQIGQWVVCLDPKEFRLRLHPIKTTRIDFCIKMLSLKDARKFGKEAISKQSEQRDDEYFMCAMCDRWLDGMCFKHPLIFVKEKIPPKMPYTVFDTLPPFLYLDTSTIPLAGLGIFTNIDLPTGVAFGPYSGFLSFLTTAEKSGYSWQIVCPDGRSVWVDAIDIEFSNWMRYVNCARYEQEQNAVGLLYHQNIYYYTYKPIPAHTEMLVWYGQEYGKYLQIPKSNKTLGPKAPRKKAAQNIPAQTIDPFV